MQGGLLAATALLHICQPCSSLQHAGVYACVTFAAVERKSTKHSAQAAAQHALLTAHSSKECDGLLCIAGIQENRSRSFHSNCKHTLNSAFSAIHPLPPAL
jgi:hypothetical protein